MRAARSATRSKYGGKSGAMPVQGPPPGAGAGAAAPPRAPPIPPMSPAAVRPPFSASPAPGAYPSIPARSFGSGGQGDGPVGNIAARSLGLIPEGGRAAAAGRDTGADPRAPNAR